MTRMRDRIGFYVEALSDCIVSNQFCSSQQRLSPFLRDISHSDLPDIFARKIYGAVNGYIAFIRWRHECIGFYCVIA